MEPDATIRSASNPVWKRIGAVLAGRDRERMVLEGDRLISDALRAGVALEALLVSEERPELLRRWRAAGLAPRPTDPRLLRKASDLTTPPGELALTARPRPRDVAELARSDAPLVLVAAGVADPGNLGAMARAAEASGCSGLVVLRGCASPWGAKALRGSMGSLLRLPVYEPGEASDAALRLRELGLRQLSAVTRGGASFETVDWRGPLALWMASETGELPEPARAFEGVTIPMRGAAESLNVAVAAGVLLFAAGRWRGGAP